MKFLHKNGENIVNIKDSDGGEWEEILVPDPKRLKNYMISELFFNLWT